ncbi:MAG TPA: hypothetical protein VK726_00060 [Acetobacteraceae bacterium]|nr:hypothetical protein [Acetobacteraceae bacterium]
MILTDPRHGGKSRHPERSAKTRDIPGIPAVAGVTGTVEIAPVAGIDEVRRWIEATSQHG